ncbi:MAG: DUF1292 domain-containing protein [Clostridia bacterium]|nr:DUF1292 domain-containing protein [Clostridia bacterium]
MEEMEYTPDLVTVVDDDGVEYVFEELDRIETDDARYVALLPTYESDEEALEADAELIILKVEEEANGDTFLAPIEDDDEFNEIADIFEERLSDYYDIVEGEVIDETDAQ